MICSISMHVASACMYTCDAHIVNVFCTGAGAGVAASSGSNRLAPQHPTPGSSHAAAAATQHTGMDCTLCESSLLGCMSEHSDCTSHSELCILVQILLTLTSHCIQVQVQALRPAVAATSERHSFPLQAAGSMQLLLQPSTQVPIAYISCE
jgi:hypothetical protein